VMISPFTTAAVGIGVGDGGNGVRVGRIGEGVDCCKPPLPPHPLLKMIRTSRVRIILPVFVLGIICVDYKRFLDRYERNLIFSKITV